MQVKGMVQATKNPRWLRVTPIEPGEFSNAMVEAGELQAGDIVTVTIEKATDES